MFILEIIPGIIALALFVGVFMTIGHFLDRMLGGGGFKDGEFGSLFLLGGLVSIFLVVVGKLFQLIGEAIINGING